MAEEMIRDERYNFLSDYAFFVYKGELDKITEEMKPKDEIEEMWVNSHIKGWENDKKEQEEYERNERLALEEASKLFFKYIHKDYWPDGKFRAKEFLKLLDEVEERVENEIKDALLEGKEPLYSYLMLLPNHVSFVNQENYRMFRTRQILKKEYKLNWFPNAKASERFLDKLIELEKKYRTRIDIEDIYEYLEEKIKKTKEL